MMNKEQKCEYMKTTIQSIIGSSGAIGETYFDNQANDNLEVKIEIMWYLLHDIADSHMLKDDSRISVKQNSQQATKALKNMRDVMNEYLEDKEDK